MSTTELRPYSPKAVYYEASDSLEYVRRDDPAVYRRIDEYLTLILDLRSRSLLGFKLKGFRYLYLTRLAPRYHLNDHQFLSLMTVLEDAMSVGANGIFEEAERQTAYREALNLAEQDDVKVDQFPKRVAN